MGHFESFMTDWQEIFQLYEDRIFFLVPMSKILFKSGSLAYLSFQLLCVVNNNRFKLKAFYSFMLISCCIFILSS